MLLVKIVKYFSYYGLWNVGGDCPCHYTPYWRTYKGALRYIAKHNMKLAESGDTNG